MTAGTGSREETQILFLQAPLVVPKLKRQPIRSGARDASLPASTVGSLSHAAFFDLLFRAHMDGNKHKESSQILVKTLVRIQRGHGR